MESKDIKKLRVASAVSALDVVLQHELCIAHRRLEDEKIKAFTHAIIRDWNMMSFTDAYSDQNFMNLYERYGGPYEAPPGVYFLPFQIKGGFSEHAQRWERLVDDHGGEYYGRDWVATVKFHSWYNNKESEDMQMYDTRAERHNLSNNRQCKIIWEVVKIWVMHAMCPVSAYEGNVCTKLTPWLSPLKGLLISTTMNDWEEDYLMVCNLSDPVFIKGPSKRSERFFGSLKSLLDRRLNTSEDSFEEVIQDCVAADADMFE